MKIAPAESTQYNLSPKMETLNNKMSNLMGSNEKDVDQIKKKTNGAGGVSWDELIERLLEIFESEEVRIKKVRSCGAPNQALVEQCNI